MILSETIKHLLPFVLSLAQAANYDNTLGENPNLSIDELREIFDRFESDQSWKEVTGNFGGQKQISFKRRFSSLRRPPSDSGDEGGRRGLQDGVISTGLADKFNCDNPGKRPKDSIYSGRSLCTYEDPPYRDYNSALGCYCLDSDDSNIEPNADDCKCLMLFWPDVFDTFHFCRSVSMIPTNTTDDIFQLQYDCSNVFDLALDAQDEPCVGRDRNGICFDIHNVPNPSNQPVIIGLFSELYCGDAPLNETLPEPYGGKYECRSPVNPPPGFPYPRTDSFVGLLCETNEPDEDCDCFVSITHPSDLSHHCKACSIEDVDDDTGIYEISFDCSNFYDIGDCVGVDDDGDCIRLARLCELDLDEGDGTLPCSDLWETEDCPIDDDDPDDSSVTISPCVDILEECIDDCGLFEGCSCWSGASFGFGGIRSFVE